MTALVTYSMGVDVAWKRVLIRGIEATTGARKLGRLYNRRSEYLANGDDAWTAALRMLDIQVVQQGLPLDQIPRTGPLVVVANHPFGIIDGLAICHLILKVRTDFRILINSVLEQVEEIRPHLLPIDFSDTKTAIKTNLKSRADALNYLKSGGVVVVFPSGGVSTAPKPFAPAIDAPWKTFAAKLIHASNATVLPVYFDGQNSRLFQIVSQFSMTLRLSLLLHEIKNKIGTELKVTIGQPLAYDHICHITDREDLILYLREQTYALANHNLLSTCNRIPIAEYPDECM